MVTLFFYSTYFSGQYFLNQLQALAHRHCNKNDMTIYDFIKAKPAEVVEAYIERVNCLPEFSTIVLLKLKTRPDLWGSERVFH